ncbi:DUF1761 domain-containing protein [Jeotgalibacillus sp. S-D1]|uniref:DUF1761 domain-containing protein n=1 Tax=Jeotgalibacillus sp. S-D1 TaxID=2552189 RepID=UPI0010599E1C|nr:DUF1761 domain-containing protein [Jeotgalibacillus sp. S-D1]TDL31787.1 DUF1761 domain-containing protein [Jeotgalibacillus sp. S-D1]
MTVDFGVLPVAAIIIGGLAYMAFGGIYYSALLSKKNPKNKEISEQQSEGPAKYILAVCVAFISSFFMAVVIQTTNIQGAAEGLAAGLSIGAVISLVYAKNCLFGLLSKKALGIAAGDHLIAFSLLGIIHGLWG